MPFQPCLCLDAWLIVRGVRAGKGEAGEVATFKGKRHLKAGMTEQLKYLRLYMSNDVIKMVFFPFM